MPRHPMPARRPIRHALAAAALLAMCATAPAQTYNWSGGTYSPGVTGPGVLALGETLNILNGSFKYFDGNVGSFSNDAGTVNWSADTLYLQNGATVANAALWNIGGDFLMVGNGGAASAFVNTGTLRKTAGAGFADFNANLPFVNNGGTIEAQVGTLRFGNGRFNAGGVFTGAGRVSAAGVNTFAGAFTSSNLWLDSGSHVGNGALVNGLVRHAGGNLLGTWSVAAGQELRGVDGGFKYLDGTLVNQGTVAWNTTNFLYLQNGGKLVNQGLVTAGADTWFFNNGGAQPSFENTASGTVRAAAGRTLSFGLGIMNNLGGRIEAEAGAVVLFNTGGSFADDSRYGGDGLVRFASFTSFAGRQVGSNLVFESGNFAGTAAVLQGQARLTGGRFTGTWENAAGSTLTGATGGFKYGSGGIFTNKGTVSWQTAHPLYLEDGHLFVNEALFEATTSSFVINNGGAAPTFRNAASGTVRAGSGTLNFGFNLMVNDGGLIEAASGASVLFSAGATFNGGSRFGGAGTVQVSAGAAFNGSQQSANLLLSAGTYTGSAAVLDGSARFSGGTITGTWQVAAGSTLAAETGGFKYLSGAATVLDNRGTLAWNTTNAWYLENGATFDNRGLFVANASTAVVYNGGAAPTLRNLASGTIRAEAGHTLAFGQGSGLVNQGVLEAAAGATVQYQSGTRFEGGTRFTGAGSHLAMGNNVFTGAVTSSGGLVLQSGVHTGDGAELRGSTTFSGGTLAGTWRIAAGHSLAAAAGNFKYLNGPATVITNEGTLEWNTGNFLYVESGAALVNAGTMQVGGVSSAMLYNGGAAVSVRNEGLLVKTGAGTSFTIGNSLGFVNAGTLDVQAGTLVLPANFSNTGRIQGSGTVQLAGTLSNAGTLSPGASPGSLQINGAFAQGAAGVFEAELENTGSHDFVGITGTAALGGTLALSCFANCSFAVGDVLTLIDSNGALSGSFAGITLSGFATGAFTPIYDTANSRFQLLVTETVTAVPEPGAYALLLGGLLAIGWRMRRQRRVR